MGAALGNGNAHRGGPGAKNFPRPEHKETGVAGIAGSVRSGKVRAAPGVVPPGCGLPKRRMLDRHREPPV